MSRVFTKVANQCLKYTGSMGISSEPFALFMWIKPTASSNTNGNGLQYWNTGSNYALMDLRATDVLHGGVNQTSGAGADTISTFTVNTWYPVILVYQADTNVYMYGLGDTIHLGSANAFVTEVSPKFLFGDDSGYQSIAAKCAHIGFLKIEPTAGQISSFLGANIPTSIWSSSTEIVDYWELTDANLTGINGRVLSVTGTVASDSADNPAVGHSGTPFNGVAISDTYPSHGRASSVIAGPLHISEILRNKSGGLHLNLSNLHATWFDSDPNLGVAPSVFAQNAYTDAAGRLWFDVSGTSLLPGQSGYLLLSDPANGYALGPISIPVKNYFEV